MHVELHKSERKKLAPLTVDCSGLASMYRIQRELKFPQAESHFQMSDTKKYASLVEQAEQAVQGVKDPELQRIAYQKILEELLNAGTPVVPEGRSKQRRSAVDKKKPSLPQKATGPRSYIREMVEEGFFSKPKSISDVKTELENRGHHIPMTSLSGPLQDLCQKKALRRQKIDGGFKYSNW